MALEKVFCVCLSVFSAQGGTCTFQSCVSIFKYIKTKYFGQKFNEVNIVYFSLRVKLRN